MNPDELRDEKPEIENSDNATFSNGTTVGIDNPNFLSNVSTSTATFTFKAKPNAGDVYTFSIPKRYFKFQSGDLSKLSDNIASVVENDTTDNYVIQETFKQTLPTDVTQTINLYALPAKDFIRSYGNATDSIYPGEVYNSEISVTRGNETHTLPVTYQLPSQLAGTIRFALARELEGDGNSSVPMNQIYIRNGQSLPYALYLYQYGLAQSGLVSAFNHGAIIRIPVPQYFTLDTSVPLTYHRTGGSLSGVTITQAGEGQDVVITIPAGSSVLNYDDSDLTNTFYFNGIMNVPDSVLNGSHTSFTTRPASITQSFNNASEQTLTANSYSLAVAPKVTNVSDGDIYGIFQQRSANYLNGTENDGSNLGGLGLSSGNTAAFTVTNNSQDTQHNTVLHVTFADGINIQKVSVQPYGNGSQRIYPAVVTYRDGTTENVANIARFADQTTDNNTYNSAGKEIAKVDVTIPSFNPGAIIFISPAHYQIATLYSNATPVKSGDNLRSTISINNDSNVITQVDQLMEPSTKHYTIVAGDFQMQNSKAPGVTHGGGIGVTWNNFSSPTAEFRAVHPILYVKLPNNASPDLAALKVSDDSGKQLNPKSVSVFSVSEDDGSVDHFLKVDLSNYDELTKGIHFGTSTFSNDRFNTDDIYLPMNNNVDATTSSDPWSSFLYTENANDSTVDIYSNDYVSHAKDLVDSRYHDSSERPHTWAEEIASHDNINIDDILSADGHTGIHWELPKYSIVTATATTTSTEAQGNQDSGLVLNGRSEVHGNPNMTFASSIINANNASLYNVQSYINVPNTADGKSQYDFSLSGPVNIVNADTGAPVTGAEVRYSTTRADLSHPSASSFVDSSSISDWSQVQSVLVTVPQMNANTAIRVVLPGTDKNITSDAGKIGYLSNATWASGRSSAEQQLIMTIQPADKYSSSIALYDENAPKNDQRATLRYYDDTDGKVITMPAADTPTISGSTGGTISFNGADVNGINSLSNYNFVGVTDASGNQVAHSGNTISYGTFDSTPDTSSNISQIFTLHFTHKTSPATSTQTRTMRRTIHYIFSDGSTHAGVTDPTPQTITFTSNDQVDQVTGKYINNDGTQTDTPKDWTPNGSFAAVTSPTVPGYSITSVTPSDQADGTNVKAVSESQPGNDITVDVTYTPQSEGVTLHYIDVYGATPDSAGHYSPSQGTELYHETTNGNYGSTYNFTPWTYGNGYRIVEQSPANALTGTFQTSNPDHYIYLTHNIINDTNPKTATMQRMVHYVFSDGSTHPGVRDVTQTINFRSTNQIDQVTGKYVTSNGESDTPTTWQITSGNFDGIASPLVTGYKVTSVTPTDQRDGDNVKQMVPTQPGNNIDVTVTYTPQEQTVNLHYIDVYGVTPAYNGRYTPDQGTTLHTDTVKGLTGTTANFTPWNYGSGYQIVEENPANPYTVTFTGNDSDHYIYLTHKTINRTDQTPVSRVINYVYSDGRVAAPSHFDSLNYTGHETVDLTNPSAATETWSPAQDFNDVTSPNVPGYKPDRTVVSDKGITHDHTPNPIVETVTYTPDTQRLTVKFIDDTTGQEVKPASVTSGTEVVKSGNSDSDSGYSTIPDINSFRNQGYDLVSDSTGGTELYFDHDDSKDQTYEVHLTHHLTPISQVKTIQELIHYQYADGTRAFSDANKTVTFTRTGTHDAVGNTDNWGNWSNNQDGNGGNYSFPAVTSPVLPNYTADQKEVPAQAVTPGSSNIEKTVIYTEDNQPVSVNYFDDTTGKSITTWQPADGKPGTSTNYSTTPTINQYKNKGYILVYDPTNGDTITYGNQPVHYVVHLAHGTTPVHQTQQVLEQIEYRLNSATGTKLFPDSTNRVTFTRTGTTDNVTKQTTYGNWTNTLNDQGNYTFHEVNSPVKPGYTANPTTIGTQTVTETNPADHLIHEVVIYTPNTQKLDVTYVDDTNPTHEILKPASLAGSTTNVISKQGPSDSDAGYNTKSDIQAFENQHYILVSDPTNGNELQFDHDDQVDQHYVVHLKHATTPTSQTKTIHETIHYVYQNGQTAAPDYSAPALTFTQQGEHDEVTNGNTWGAWTPAESQTFAAHQSPTIAGYTPDLSWVSAHTVSPNDNDVVYTVTYRPEQEGITVNYIDQDNNDLLSSDHLTGASNADANYNTQAKIRDYQSRGYDLANDETKGQGLKFGSDPTKPLVYNVYFTHHINQNQQVGQSVPVTMTVNYTYANGPQKGKQAAPSNVQTITFTNHQNYDNVTKQYQGLPNWTSDTTGNTFKDVTSPTVTGYTPSVNIVKGATVTHTSASKC